VLILLPPSETKAAGGEGPPLDFGSLSFPELTAPRAALIDDLAALSMKASAARRQLFAPPSKDAEIEQNVHLRTAATMPALQRYTGVLYDALDARGMTSAQRARADARLIVTSAVFGMVRASDRIPAYRCSHCARLPKVGTPERYWRSHLPDVVGSWDQYVVDLRSSSFAVFVAVPGALTARVVTEMPDGRRKVVSHFSKFHKGLLARALAVSRAEIDSRAAVLRVARAAGLRIEPLGRDAVQIVTEPAESRSR
jgi:cytoplasmic iron level regulating protein YaaA (DUF328/UPF0246 family)